ncbi:hypothetical protein ScalyP_jg6973 [Parmales sp. scaly parma]|nr:hypothetical protein ScalyP_jg6973 [Parmales sp. scaly parma]
MSYAPRPLESLPYVDYIHPDYETYALSLIEAEMKDMESSSTPPTNYLSHLPQNPPSSSTSHLPTPLLNNEYASTVKRNGGAKKTTDFTDYNLLLAKSSVAPTRDDIHTWKKSLSATKASYEHSNTTLMNLQLLQEFGATKWLVHNKSLATLKQGLAEELEQSKMSVDGINTVRKAEQEEVIQKIGGLGRKWEELVTSGNALELENARLKKQKR